MKKQRLNNGIKSAILVTCLTFTLQACAGGYGNSAPATSSADNAAALRSIKIFVSNQENRDVFKVLYFHRSAVFMWRNVDLDGLRAAEITFWMAWEGTALAGCGALKILDASHGEVKSMRTDPAFVKRGVGAAILEQIISEATARGLKRLSLETGPHAPFMAAHRLYMRHGFVECGPFGDYSDRVFSRYFTRDLSRALA